MSGGYGRGGYPGQGYPEPEYEGDPRQQRGGSGGPGGPGPGGQGGPGYGGYNGPSQGQRPGPGGPGGPRGPQGRDPRGHDPRGGYDQQQGSGAYRQQGTGGYPQQGSGGYPQQGTGGYRQQGGGPQYDQGPYDGQYGQGPRGPRGRDPRRRDPRDGYQDQRWGSDEDQTSFMPGFGGGRGDNGRDGYDDGRRGYDDGRRGYDDGRGDFDDNRGRGRDRGRADFDNGDRGNFGDSRRGDFDDDRGRGGRNRDDWDDDLDRKPRKKVTRWFPRILVMATVAVVLIGGGVGAKVVYGKYEARYHPPDFTGAGTGTVVFQVKSGDTAFSVAPELLADGVVASTRALENAATAAAATSSAGLEPGYYALHKGEQASLVWAYLSNPKNAVQTKVTVPEGKRTIDTLKLLAQVTKIPLSQFETAVTTDRSKLGLPSYAGTTVKLPATVPFGQVEGFLFPDTYLITPHETALQIVQAMVAAFNANAQQTDLVQDATSVGLSPEQLVTEASMVQDEAGTLSDMPKIAEVFNNRKAANMPDGSDAVVVYGLGIYDLNITPAQAQASGVYNNTQTDGLPPTPIDNPGNEAINAVLHPDKGNLLYFLGNGTGKNSTFSATPLPGTA